MAFIKKRSNYAFSDKSGLLARFGGFTSIPENFSVSFTVVSTIFKFDLFTCLFDRSHWLTISTFAISMFAFLKQFPPFTYIFLTVLSFLPKAWSHFLPRKLFYKFYSNRNIAACLFIETRSFSSVLYENLLF